MSTEQQIIKQYIERRVHKLIADGFSDFLIVQQLEATAIGGARLVKDELKKQRSQ